MRRSNSSPNALAPTIAARRRTHRRKLLTLLIATPFLPPLAHAVAGESAAAAGERFMALSKFVTGRAKLDPDIGAQLLAALRDSDASLGAELDALAADASTGKYPDVESLEAALGGTPRHAALLALVSAWYTGTVNVHGNARVITVTDALMYQPIADGSHIPGNCGGATNSWAQLSRPALADIPA